MGNVAEGAQHHWQHWRTGGECAKGCGQAGRKVMHQVVLVTHKLLQRLQLCELPGTALALALPPLHTVTARWSCCLMGCTP